MQSLADFYPAYAELEYAVRQLMAEWCSETCGLCTACCCRADICEEAPRSPFLVRLLQEQGISAGHMDDRFGWLDLHGCSLAYGRPPVCYAYFCDELLGDLPDDVSRQVLRTLGRLVHHIGERALDERHLVEIPDPEQLELVDCARLFRRLDEARAAFEAIQAFQQSGRLTAAERAVLDRISTCDP